MDDPGVVDLRSQDLSEQRLQALVALLPGVAEDGVLDAGRLGEAVGLPVTGVGTGAERFGLMWAGRSSAMQSLLKRSRASLSPESTALPDFDSSRNVFVEGDNLEILKLCQKAYNDQVKLVYIDPPYNLGKDLIYEDDYADGLTAYLRFTGQVDDFGNRLSASVDVAGRIHSRWLSMMYPRLALARNVLRQDGVLLVSISDREVAYLKAILDDIFGAENFLATFIWNNDGNIEQQSDFKINHEYILAYARNVEEVRSPSIIDPNISEDSKLYNQEIENSITKNGPKNPASVVTLPIGFPVAVEEMRLEPRTDSYPRILDPILVKNFRLERPARVESGWSSRKQLLNFIAANFVPISDSEGRETRFDLTATGAIYQYKKRSAQHGHVLTVLKNMGTTKASSSRLKRRFNLNFSYPKPEALIKYLVNVFTENDDLVLDFFAGSGTTAEAVVRANLEDGGRRRFMIVQLPEVVDDEQTTIATMCRRRIELACKDIAEEAALSGVELDTAMRCYSLDRSNFSYVPDTKTASDDLLALLGNESTLVDGASDDDVVAEIALAEGKRLDAAWSRHSLQGHSVVKVEALAVVLSRQPDDVLVKALAERNDISTVVFLEDAFLDRDHVKTNAALTFRQVGIEMRTV